jgi:hypothetical protein
MPRGNTSRENENGCLKSESRPGNAVPRTAAKLRAFLAFIAVRLKNAE